MPARRTGCRGRSRMWSSGWAGRSREGYRMAGRPERGGERGGDSPLPVGSRLPSLGSRSDIGDVRWRDPSRGATVAVFLQSSDHDADRHYLDELAAASSDFALWGGRVIVVMPEGSGGDARSGDGEAARSLA